MFCCFESKRPKRQFFKKRERKKKEEKKRRPNSDLLEVEMKKEIVRNCDILCY